MKSLLILTGVSPIMLDDLTSGYNMTSNITLDKEFNDSLGFTQTDTEAIMATTTAIFLTKVLKHDCTIPIWFYIL